MQTPRAVPSPTATTASRRNPRAAAAYHEAGHAVAAVLEHRRFRYVTIVPDTVEGTLGHCLYAPWPAGVQPERGEDGRVEGRIRAAIITLYAGHAAEALFTGRNNWRGSASDRHAASQLATYVTGSTEEQRAYLRWLWIHTQALAQTERAPITALATTMLGGQLTLGYRTALAIIRQARREPWQYDGST
jgi:Peptidase family M41